MYRILQDLTVPYRLRPRDAIYDASAIINKVKSIISGDLDFDRIKNIKRKAWPRLYLSLGLIKPLFSLQVDSKIRI